ncbi:MAG: hypothetical protein M3N23_04915, partial [Pseudomonadota bacterium]|nr:hypothetical protein [Pseudomonadota bacterium]
ARLAAGDKSDKKGDAADNNVLDDGLQANERNVSASLAAEKAQKAAKDIYLNEAADVMTDEVELLKNNSKLAARVAGGAAIGKAERF